MAKRIDIVFGSSVDSSGALNDVKSFQKSIKDLKIKPQIDDSFVKEFQKNLKIIKDEQTKLNTLTSTASSNGISYNITQRQSRNHQYYPAEFSIDESKSINTLESNLKTLYRNAIELQGNINSATKSGLTTYVNEYKSALDEIKKQISDTESSLNLLSGGSETDNRLKRLKSTLKSTEIEGNIAEQSKQYKILDNAIANLTTSEERLAKAKANMNSESTINAIQEETNYWKQQIEAIKNAANATEDIKNRADAGIKESSLNSNSTYAVSMEKYAINILPEYQRSVKQISKAETERATIVKKMETADDNEKNTLTALLSIIDNTIASKKEHIDTIEKESSETDAYNKALEYRKSVEQETEKNIALINSKGTKTIDVFAEMKKRVSETVEEFLTIGVVDELFNSITQSITQAIDTIKELNAAMTDVQMVTGGTNEETQALATQYSNLAEELGATTTEIANGASEWLRQGKSIEETSQLLKASMTLSKVGAIESSQATELLTSTLNGYKMEASDAMNVVDALSRVDLVAATSVEELAEALQHTANMARVNGVGFNDLVGMIGAVSEATRRSASVVGNSFKTIFSRLTNIAAGKDVDDEGEPINDVEQSLENVGIKLRDTNNEWRNMYDVISEIATKWSSFSSLEQSQISTAVAGTRQRETWLSLMENWERARTLSTEAENSMGSASEKMAIYTDSIEGKLKSLEAAYEDLVYTESAQDLFKFTIDSGRTLIEVINTLSNNSFVKLVAAGATATLAINKFRKAWSLIGNAEEISKTSKLMQIFVSGLSKIKSGKDTIVNAAASASTAISSMSTNMQVAAASGAGLSGAFTVLGGSIKAAGAALLSSPFVVVTSVIAGISLINKIIDDMTVTLEEAQQALDETTSKIGELQSEYDSLSSKNGDLTENERERLKLLEAQLEVLQKQKETEEKNVVATQVKGAVVGNYKDTNMSDYEGNKANREQAHKELKPESYNLGINTDYGIVDVKTALMDLEMYNEQLKNIDVNSENAAQQWDEIAEKQNEASAYLLGWAELLQDAKDSGYTLTGDAEKIAEMLNSSSIFADLLNNNLESSSETANELNDSTEDIATQLEEANNAVTSAMSSVNEGMDMISSLENEISESGIISLDTLNSLIEKYPQLINVVSQYLTGLASTTDIMNALQEAYEVDQTNLYNSLLAKLQMQDWYAKFQDPYIQDEN